MLKCCSKCLAVKLTKNTHRFLTGDENKNSTGPNHSRGLPARSWCLEPCEFNPFRRQPWKKACGNYPGYTCQNCILSVILSPSPQNPEVVFFKKKKKSSPHPLVLAKVAYPPNTLRLSHTSICLIFTSPAYNAVNVAQSCVFLPPSLPYVSLWLALLIPVGMEFVFFFFFNLRMPQVDS